MSSVTEDYSVTWNSLKPLFEEKLQKRHIGGDDKVAFGTLVYILEKTWDDVFEAKEREYGHKL